MHPLRAHTTARDKCEGDSFGVDDFLLLRMGQANSDYHQYYSKAGTNSTSKQTGSTVHPKLIMNGIACCFLWLVVVLILTVLVIRPCKITGSEGYTSIYGYMTVVVMYLFLFGVQDEATGLDISDDDDLILVEPDKPTPAQPVYVDLALPGNSLTHTRMPPHNHIHEAILEPQLTAE